jgi:hypothetical protein
MPPIKHIFYEKEWFLNEASFKTKSAILSEVLYEPKILILGTFNPEQPGNNPNFYYGRNFLWPLLFNLLKYKSIHYKNKNNNKDNTGPTLVEILELCKNYHLVFGDLIAQVLHVGNPEYRWEKRIGRGRPSQNLIYQEKKFNLIQDNNKTEKGIITYGLNELKKDNQIDWNTPKIKKYITDHKSIETVYLTCNPAGEFKTKWKEISNYNYGRIVKFRRLFTPSAQGTPKNCDKMKYVLQHWLGKFDSNGNYEGIDLNWLRTFLSDDEIVYLKKLDYRINKNITKSLFNLK